MKNYKEYISTRPSFRLYLILTIPVSIIAVLLVHFLKTPNPMMILIIPVVYFSYPAGYIGGILSGLISIIYSLYFFSNSYPVFTFPPTFNEQNIQKISTIIIAVSVIIVLVGRLKYRDMKAMLAKEKHIKEMEEINAEIDKAIIKAEQANRAKSDFLATMSHEIRTPLNAVIGFSNILLQKDSLDDEIRTEIRKIHNSGNSLLYLVNDILDLSKIENGKLEIIPNNYDISVLLSDTIQLNVVRIGNKPIIFQADIDKTLPKILFGDEFRIKQILNNILSNAIKYTNEGNIWFNVSCTKNTNGYANIVFKIKDTGIGIKKEDKPKLFGKYQRLDAKANRKTEGTGLGLSITQKLVELMDGKIYFESEFGKGSIFTVEIKQKIIDESEISKALEENINSLNFTERRKADRNNSLRKKSLTAKFCSLTMSN